jgi:hypothetical protein
MTFDPTFLEKCNVMMIIAIDDLKKCEWDLECQNYLVESNREKLEEGHKEHNLALT